MKIVYKNPCTKELEDEFFLTEFNKTDPELQIWNLKNAEEGSLLQFLREKSLEKIEFFNTLIVLHSSFTEDYLARIREILSIIFTSLEYPVSLIEEIDQDCWGRLLIGENLKGISYHRDLDKDCLILIALEDSLNNPFNFWEIGLRLKEHFLEKSECSSLVSFKESPSIDETLSFYRDFLETPTGFGVVGLQPPRYRKIEKDLRIPISNTFPEQDTFLSKVWKKSHSNFLFETLNALIFIKIPLYMENELASLKSTILSELCLQQKYREITDAKGWGRVTLSGMITFLTYTEKTPNSIIYYVACPGRDPQEYQDSFFDTPFSTKKIILSLGTEEDLRNFLNKVKGVLVDAEIY